MIFISSNVTIETLDDFLIHLPQQRTPAAASLIMVTVIRLTRDGIIMLTKDAARHFVAVKEKKTRTISILKLNVCRLAEILKV